MKSILLFSCLVLFLSTCRNGEKEPASKGIHNLDLVALMKMSGNLTLSQVASGIEYIPLQTNSEILLGSIKFCVSENFIYVLNRDQKVLLFDRGGKFLRTIGNRGQGPGEYLGAQDIQVSPDGSLITLYSTAASLGYVYAINGELRGTFKIAYPSWRFAPLSNGKHLMIAPYGDFSFTGEGMFLYFVQDSTGAVVQRYPSRDIIRLGGDFSIGRFFINPLSTLAYVPFVDTIYRVNGDGFMVPRYVTNFGQFRIPNEAYGDFSVLQQNKYGYITSFSLVETGTGVFLRYSFQNELYVGLYDLNQSSLKSFNSSMGLIINDFDGGPNVFPSGSDGEKEIYSLLQPVELLIQYKDGSYANKSFSKSEANRNFLKFMSELSENDNPVLMVITLK